MAFTLGLCTPDPTSFTIRRLSEVAADRGLAVTLLHPLDLSVRVAGGRAEAHAGGRELAIDALVHLMSTDYLAGLDALDALESVGLPHLNRAPAVRLAADKMASAMRLAAAGLDVPVTVGVGSVAEALRAAESFHGPVVVKAVDSAGGYDVHRAADAPEAAALAEGILRRQHRVLIQEYVTESAGTDIRVVVIGGRVVTAMRRTARAGEFRANIGLGASPERIVPSSTEAAAALRAAAVLGLDIAGVDMVRAARGPLVLEVNSFPGFADHPIDVEVFDAIVDAAVHAAARRGR